MSKDLNLTSLGLDGLRVVESDSIELPASLVGRGASAVAETATDYEPQMPPPGARTADLACPLIQEAGIESELVLGPLPRLKLVCPPGRRIPVMPLGPRALAFRRDPEAPEVVLLYLERGPFLVDRELLVEIESTSVPPRLIVRKLASESDLVPLAPPWDEWLTGCRDKWLVSRLQDRIALQDTWQQITAVGVLMRLRDDARVQPAADGTPRLTDASLAPRRWFRRLNAIRILEIESLLDSEIILLEEDLSSLRSEWAPFDEAWRIALLRLLRSRDDIESVRVLLLDAHVARQSAVSSPDEAWPEPEAEASVRAFDRRARTFLRALPPDLALADPCLLRVKSWDPAAWWAAPIRR